MALNFQGDRAVGVLNDPKNTFNTDDLFRVYDGGILVAGGVSVDHGDFVSWDGTKWKLEAGVKIVNTSTLNPESVPESVSESNPLMTAEDTERMINMMKPIDDMTLRFEFSKKDYSPVVAGVGFIDGKEEYCTWTRVPSPTLNVWDWKYWDGETNEWDWSNVFKDVFTDQDNEVSIIASGDLSNVHKTFGMFQSSDLKPNNIVSCCDLSFPGSLVALYMFCNTNLKKAPNLSFKDDANVSSIFTQCTRLEELGKLEGALSGCQSSFEFAKNVKYGMLEMYERLSNQDPAIAQHGFCFADCGIDTEEGRAALAQIPQSWGGLAAG